jgi:two-component system, cell cycle response regulator
MNTKILTVDDSRTVRLIVGKALKRFDCVVLEAANGADGLAVAAREKPDLILLDYTMPVMDGFETMSQLVSRPELKTIPVVMLTADGGRETMTKMAQLGVRDYLVKPFKEDLVIERIRRIVALNPRTESAPLAPALTAVAAASPATELPSEDF